MEHHQETPASNIGSTSPLRNSVTSTEAKNPSTTHHPPPSLNLTRTVIEPQHNAPLVYGVAVGVGAGDGVGWGVRMGVGVDLDAGVDAGVGVGLEVNVAVSRGVHTDVNIVLMLVSVQLIGGVSARIDHGVGVCLAPAHDVRLSVAVVVGVRVNAGVDIRDVASLVQRGGVHVGVHVDVQVGDEGNSGGRSWRGCQCQGG